MNNIVVFASGSGTNFQSIIDAVARGEIEAKIQGLVTNNKNAGALEKAQNHNIDTYIIDEEKINSGLHRSLEKWKPDLIVLAGFLKKLPENLIDKYKGKIINIHPSLLPKYGGKGFYGIHVHRAVLENNESETGCTVHLVTKEYDEGPVLAQQKIQVRRNETPQSLAKRVLQEEHKLLPKVISEIFKNKKSATS